MLAASRTLRSARSGPGPTRLTVVKCGGCAAAFGRQDWLALPLVGTLAGDAITAHVVRWPHGVRIEIRRCERCARPIARIGPVRGEPELPSSSTATPRVPSV